MKRIIFVLLLVLSASGLFAKDKKILEKKSKYSFIGLYESSDLKNTDGFKYYIAINEDNFEGGRFLFTVVSNNYDKIKAFMIDMYKAGIKLEKPLWAFYPGYYMTFNEDLTLAYENTEIDSENNQIIDMSIFVLE